MNKVNYSDFVGFMSEYYESPKSEKFGEAFLKRYFPDIENPYLARQSDVYKAVEIIVDEYIDENSSEEFYSEIAQR